MAFAIVKKARPVPTSVAASSTVMSFSWATPPTMEKIAKPARIENAEFDTQTIALALYTSSFLPIKEAYVMALPNPGDKENRI